MQHATGRALMVVVCVQVKVVNTERIYLLSFLFAILKKKKFSKRAAQYGNNSK